MSGGQVNVSCPISAETPNFAVRLTAAAGGSCAGTDDETVSVSVLVKPTVNVVLVEGVEGDDNVKFCSTEDVTTFTFTVTSDVLREGEKIRVATEEPCKLANNQLTGEGTYFLSARSFYRYLCASRTTTRLVQPARAYQRLFCQCVSTRVQLRCPTSYGGRLRPYEQRTPVIIQHIINMLLLSALPPPPGPCPAITVSPCPLLCSRQQRKHHPQVHKAR